MGERAVFISRQKFDLEVDKLLLCRVGLGPEIREQVGDAGCGVGKDGKVADHEEEEEEEEEEWKDDEGEETDGSQAIYRKHEWKVVAVWTHMGKEEAYRRAAEIITTDFNIAGGPMHSWGEPSIKKIGPCSARNVSVYFFCLI